MKVHVHAWEYCNGESAGGGGFDWFDTAEKADEAYRMADGGENAGHFRFEFETDLSEPDAITAAIDDKLSELCAAATTRKVGPALLAYWQTNNFRMGTDC